VTLHRVDARPVEPRATLPKGPTKYRLVRNGNLKDSILRVTMEESLRVVKSSGMRLKVEVGGWEEGESRLSNRPDEVEVEEEVVLVLVIKEENIGQPV
jgi:hypothetical protein